MMTTVDLFAPGAAEQLAELIPKYSTGRCIQCGANWEIRHDDYAVCPFCASSFHTAFVNFDGTFVEMEGERRP